MSDLAHRGMSNGEHVKKPRAKQACRMCNSRRIRCDVTERHPCSNCTTSDASCEVVPSRRGRYPRRPHRPDPEYDAGPSPAPVQVDRSTASSVNSDADRGAPARNGPEVRRSGSGLFATPGSSSGLFYGESNFLTVVPGHLNRDDRPAPVSESIEPPVAAVSNSPQPRTTATVAGYFAEASRANEASPTEDFLDIQHFLPAIRAYFQWFHTCFPVLDSPSVASKLRAGGLPPILLNAMLFIGSTYCDETAIRAMGFRDRSEAKTAFYNRTKLLFHTDAETDRITLIQALFIASFWRAGPHDVRDVRYWLGIVITIAESFGLHRSECYTTRDAYNARMRRRIWWSIYVRERQSAVALGLPSRIRDLDCDIEPLSLSDMEQDGDDSGDAIFGPIQPEHKAYVLNMIEAARLLGRIIDINFMPGRVPLTAEKVQELDNALEAWRCNLPDHMRDIDTSKSSISTYLLHLAYNHLRILIHRNGFLANTDDHGRQVVLGAACQISRIAEDMLTQKTVQYGQMHLVTSFFAALCIHSISLKSTTGVAKKIAEHRAQICLLGLQELNNYWRINNNVLDLFLEYLDEPTAQQLHQGADKTDTSATENRPYSTRAPARPRPPLPASSAPNSVHLNPVHLPLGQHADLFEGQYLSFVNSIWEGHDATGYDLGFYLDPTLYYNGDGNPGNMQF